MNGKRLLLIEDDHDIAEMLLMYFRAHRYDILHADTGRSGIEMARTKFPAVILLDVMLPDMDGFSVCEEIRQTSITRYIPIIFLTQKDTRASKVRGLELGADDYITKPFDVDELRLRIQGSIARASRESLHEARTGLPTGALVQEEITHRQTMNTRFQQITLKLEGFSNYNEAYGFMAANEVLTYAARAIYEIISKDGTTDDFLGFDDERFVILTHADDAQKLTTLIQQHFHEGVKAFYSFQDVQQGGLMVNTGTDVRELVPLMQLKVM
jgi:DNA-binding response OmpR family regulator